MAVLAVKISVKNSPAIAGWLPRRVLCSEGWRVVNGMMEHVTGNDRKVNESSEASDRNVMAMEDKRMADKRMKTQPMRSNTLSAVRLEHARNPQPSRAQTSKLCPTAGVLEEVGGRRSEVGPFVTRKLSLITRHY